MNRSFVYSFTTITFILMIHTVNIFSQPKVIAHRGYWEVEGSAQNSGASLYNANRIGCWGSEFDVIVTSDGVAVLNHDDHINGIRVDSTHYETISHYTLKNGERLPLLEDFLKQGLRYDSIRLVLELKPHRTKELERVAVEKVFDIIEKTGAKSRVDIISFSLYICTLFREQSENIYIYYLNGDKSPEELSEIGISGIDYNYKVLQKNPQWVKEAHDLGMKVNVWTVNTDDLIREMIDLKVDFITTDKPERVQHLIRQP